MFVFQTICYYNYKTEVRTNMAEIHGVFLKYFASEDISTYSIDEPFIDITP